MLDINLTLPIMMVMFLVFAVAMNAVFFGPVTRVLAERRAHILRQQNQADEAIQQAQGLQASYEARLKDARLQAQDALQVVLKESDSRRQAMLEGVKAEIATDLEAARASIQAERNTAIASLHTEVNNFSESIKRKVSGSSPALSGSGSPQSGGHE